MALNKTITEKIRLVGDLNIQAYITVNEISGGKNNIVANVVYRKESKNGEFIKDCQISFCPSLDGENFIAQAYAHLKTLPEFADAVDC